MPALALHLDGVDDSSGVSGEHFPKTTFEVLFSLEWIGLCILSHLPLDLGLELMLSKSIFERSFSGLGLDSSIVGVFIVGLEELAV